MEEKKQKRKPVGLGAKLARRDTEADQIAEESPKQPDLFFQVEEDAGELDELRALYLGAKAASSSDSSQQAGLTSLELYRAVVHECDRMLRVYDLSEEPDLDPASSFKPSPEYYRIYGEALMQLSAENDSPIEFLNAAYEKFEMGVKLLSESNVQTDREAKRLAGQMAICMLQQCLASRKRAVIDLNLFKALVSSFSAILLIEEIGDVFAVLLELCEALKKKDRAACISILADQLIIENDLLLENENCKMYLLLVARLASSKAMSVSAATEPTKNNLDECIFQLEYSAKLFDQFLRSSSQEPLDARVAFGEVMMLKGGLHALLGDLAMEEECYAKAAIHFRTVYDRDREMLDEVLVAFMLDIEKEHKGVVKDGSDPRSEQTEDGPNSPSY